MTLLALLAVPAVFVVVVNVACRLAVTPDAAADEASIERRRRLDAAVAPRRRG